MRAKVYLLILMILSGSYLLILGDSNAQITTPNLEELNKISVENSTTMTELTSITEENQRIWHAVFSSEDDLIAYSTDSSFVVWDMNIGNSRWRIPIAPIYFEFDPATPYIAVVSDKVKLWGIETANELLVLSSPPEPVTLGISDIAFSERRNELIAVYTNERAGLVRWNAETGEFISSYNYGLDWFSPPHNSILSPDASLNVVLYSENTRDFTIELRNTLQGQIRNRVQVDKPFLNIESDAVSFQLLVLGISFDNQDILLHVRPFDSRLSNQIVLLNASGEIDIQIEHEHDVILSGAFAPDGSVLALGNSVNGEIYIWNAKTGEELATLRGHTEWVTSLTFNPEGTLLMSTSTDGTMRLWGAPAGE